MCVLLKLLVLLHHSVGRTVVVYWHFPFLQPWSVSATSGPGAKPRWPPTKGHSLCLAPPRPLVNHFRAISPLQKTNKEDNIKTNIIPRQSSFFGQSFWGHLFLVWDKEANYENGLAGSFSFTEITKQRGRVKNFGAIKAHQHTNQHTCMDTRGTRQSFSFGFSSADPQTHLWSL